MRFCPTKARLYDSRMITRQLIPRSKRELRKLEASFSEVRFAVSIVIGTGAAVFVTRFFVCDISFLAGRVLGILAVAHSFGDHGLKQFVSARPHITITEVTPEHDFIALCCDGVFDVMEDDDVVEFIRENSKNGPNPKISQMLVEEALKRRSTDNITALVVYL